MLQLEFTPSPSGAYQFASVNPRYFNKLDCDDVFKGIESKTADGLAYDINVVLEELRNRPPPAPLKEMQPTCPEKRPLTPLFTASQSRSKKQKVAPKAETSHVKGVQARCDECQLDSSVY